jgi:hypothetical protein
MSVQPRRNLQCERENLTRRSVLRRGCTLIRSVVQLRCIVKNFARILSVVILAVVPCAASGSACATPPITPLNLSLPGHPFQVVISKNGCWGFVSLLHGDDAKRSGVGVLRWADGHVSLSSVVPLNPGPVGMVMTHDEKLLIAANGEDVLILDVSRLLLGRGEPVIAVVREGLAMGPIYVNLTADDSLLFVSNEKENTVGVIRLAELRSSGLKGGLRLIGKIPVGEAPIALTFSPDQRLLYTTSETAVAEWGWPPICEPELPTATNPKHPAGAIVVVDVELARTTPARSVVARVPAGCNPVRLAVSPRGDRAYVTARKSNAVLAFDANKLVANPFHAQIGSVPVGTAPVPLVLINGGRELVVGNWNRFGTSPVGTETLTVLNSAQMDETVPQ